MTRRQGQEGPVPGPSGRRRPPKPPARVGGDLKELPSDEFPGLSHGSGGHPSKEEIGRMRRSMTCTAVELQEKLSAALSRWQARRGLSGK
jgi:hypothetical protein